MKQQFYIAELISKHITGSITAEEERELAAWREESPSNQELFDRLCDSEEFREHYLRSLNFNKQEGWQMLNRKMHTLKRRNLLVTIGRCAAILLLPLLIGVTTYRMVTDENTVAEQMRNQNIQILPGEKRATLTLEDGRVIDLKNTGETSMNEKDGTTIQIDSTTLNYKLTDEARTAKTPTQIFNKVDVPRGGEYALTLSDGTRIHLNSMTSMRFPVRFAGDTREVELEGEAYFEVMPDRKPFMVKYNGVTVQVLGTCFNVSAYPGQASHTTLVNGAVKVSLDAGGEHVLSPSQQTYLEPGSSELQVRTVDTSLYTSWVNGKIYFKDARLEEIMNSLSRWYDIEVIYADDDVKELRFGCNINKYKEITPFLELLERTDKLEIEIKGRTITFKHNN